MNDNREDYLGSCPVSSLMGRFCFNFNRVFSRFGYYYSHLTPFRLYFKNIFLSFYFIF